MVRGKPAPMARADEFVFQISKDEYLDLLFEDLALPNLKKNQQRQLNEFKTHRAGFTANGVPANISVVRSLQNSLARRTAMTAGKRRELRALEDDLDTIAKANQRSCWKRSGYVKRLRNYGLKLSACRLSTPLIYAIKL